MINTSNPIPPQMPDELISICLTYCLPYCSISELYKYRLISKQWYQLSNQDGLWMDFYKELNPCKDEKFFFEQKNVQLIVFSDLQKNHKKVDEIISYLIDNDNKIDYDDIATIICPSTSLNKLKNKSLLDRSFYFINEVRRKENTHEKLLIEKIKSSFNDPSVKLKYQFTLLKVTKLILEEICTSTQ